jgi:hypothetical protein
LIQTGGQPSSTRTCPLSGGAAAHAPSLQSPSDADSLPDQIYAARRQGKQCFTLALQGESSTRQYSKTPWFFWAQSVRFNTIA